MIATRLQPVGCFRQKQPGASQDVATGARVDCAGQHCASTLGLTRQARLTRGVTLVELLITITILTIIAAAVVFASFQATTAARIANTQTRVSTLNTLLMEKYDEFQTRRVDVPSTGNTPGDWQVQAIRRLRGIRMLMRLEMPDRWSDIVLGNVEDHPPQGAADVLNAYPSPSIGRTALSLAYLRRYNNLKTADGGIPSADDIEANQGAECLYMIITLATADGEALSLFNANDVGDVDGDGAPEFLDAWGRPIHYLFAAPGFTLVSGVQSGDPLNDHDPFDPYQVDPQAYRLIPLIYSGGPDGDPDLDTQKDMILFGHKIYQSPRSIVGSPLIDDNDGENWHDNIHNHELDVNN